MSFSDSHTSIWFLLTSLTLCFAQHGLSIDNPLFLERVAEQLGNRTEISLEQCNAIGGTAWTLYPWGDIQSRIGTWVVPLLILIGSFQFARLRLLNTVFVALHFMADPFTSIYNLLTKLATQQEIYRRCQNSSLPDSAKKSVAIILAAYEDWESYFLYVSTQNGEDLAKKMESSMTANLNILRHQLTDGRPHLRHLRDQRINKCQQAAKELSDCRINGLGKTLLGTVNYIVALVMAFLHVTQGDFNNRTGHSMAFGVLWTWLLVIVSLSSIIGGFITKRSARTILGRLQRHFDRMDDKKEKLNQQAQLPQVPHEHRHQSFIVSTPRAQDSDEPRREISFSSSNPIIEEDQEFLMGASQKPALFAFHIVESDKVNEAYRSLEWIGMNYCVSPSILCPKSWRRPLAVVSTIPVLVSTAAACWISATNPTPGFGCRSVQQLAYLLAWTASALLTIFFRGKFHGKTQLTLIRLKDLAFGLPIGVFFGLGFIGWFNSCFCWSSWFSNLHNAYIILYPAEMILHLAKTTWPTLCFTAVSIQLLYIFTAYMWFRKGAILYSMDDEEHEKWYNAEIMASRRKSSVIDLSGRVRTFNSGFSFSAGSRRKSSGFIQKDVTVHIESLELS
jgi:hypothetical protein